MLTIKQALAQFPGDVSDNINIEDLKGETCRFQDWEYKIFPSSETADWIDDNKDWKEWMVYLFCDGAFVRTFGVAERYHDDCDSKLNRKHVKEIVEEYLADPVAAEFVSEGVCHG